MMMVVSTLRNRLSAVLAMFGSVVLAVAPGSSVRAEDNAAELAKTRSNPLASLISVPLQGNTTAVMDPRRARA